MLAQHLLILLFRLVDGCDPGWPFPEIDGLILADAKIFRLDFHHHFLPGEQPRLIFSSRKSALDRDPSQPVEPLRGLAFGSRAAYHDKSSRTPLAERHWRVA